MLSFRSISLISIIFLKTVSNLEESPTISPQEMSSPVSTCAGVKGDDGYCSSADHGQKQKCDLTPQSYEGPFFLPNQPIREDIREGRPGVPLRLNFIVKNTNCQPVQDVQVHVWHADALGVYSAYSGYYPLGEPGSKQIKHPHSEPTEEATFLRGIQITDNNGKASFQTIYPGWYRYRTLHLHFKITDTNGKDKYTGEIYFLDELTDKISKVAEPYKEHDGKRTKNQQDSQFNHEGKYLVMRPKGSIEQGLEGEIEIIIANE